MRSFLCPVYALLLVLPVFGQQHLERELPLSHANAVQVAAMFGAAGPAGTPRPSQDPGGEALELFAGRCVAAAAREVGVVAGRWQYYLETGPGSWISPAATPQTAGTATAGSLRGLLPLGLDGPPEAVLERNALRARGTPEALDKLREVVALLDKPLAGVELQVELLQGTAALWQELAGLDWQLPVSAEQSPVVLRFTRTSLGSLRQTLAAAGNPARLAATVITGNNSPAELRAAEALPQWWALPGAEAAAPRVTARCLGLRLVPRLNADGSATVLVQIASTAGRTVPPETARLDHPVTQLTCQTQVRVADGESILISGLGGATAVGAAAAGDDSLLARPVLLVTPRALSNMP